MARHLKRRNPDRTPAEIAGMLGEDVTGEAVSAALATLRTRNPRRSRSSINATVEAAGLVEGEGLPGEARWQTMDRLLAELLRLRAVVAGIRAERQRVGRG